MFSRGPRTASEWAVRLSQSPLKSAEQARLEKWLAADPRRARELDMARAVWGLASDLEHSPTAQAAAARSAAEMTPAKTAGAWAGGRLLHAAPAMAALAAVGVIAAALYFGNFGVFSNHERASMSTSIGEISNYVLPDGSLMALNADSTAQVDFSSQRRDIALTKGEAFFEVRSDAARPFIVKAGEREVIVKGTRFNVNYNASQGAIEVAVVEGRVNVHQAGEDKDRIPDTSLVAGQVVLFPRGAPEVQRKLPANLAAEWRSYKLYFDQATLADVLVQVNRFSRKPIVIRDPALKDLLLTGSFQANDQTAVLFAIRELYQLSAVERGSEILLVKDSAP